MGVWGRGLGPVGEGLVTQVRLPSSGSARSVGPPLGSLSLLSPKHWLRTLLSTLQDKLSIQALGPGLGWGLEKESVAFPVPFPLPTIYTEPERGDAEGDRAG